MILLTTVTTTLIMVTTTTVGIATVTTTVLVLFGTRKRVPVKVWRLSLRCDGCDVWLCMFHVGGDVGSCGFDLLKWW